jgi:hypothetical protein
LGVVFLGVAAHGCWVELASDQSAFTDSIDGRKEAAKPSYQGHAEELAVIQFIEAALFKNELPEKEDVTLCETRLILRYN